MKFNFTEEETIIIINALNDQWSQGILDYKGIELIVMLENALGIHKTENYLKEVKS